MPRQRCLELKSLKEYLFSYRNLGIFQENIVNQVLEDVVKACDPVWAGHTRRVPSPRRHRNHRRGALAETFGIVQSRTCNEAWVPHPFRVLCGMGGKPRTDVEPYSKIMTERYLLHRYRFNNVLGQRISYGHTAAMHEFMSGFKFLAFSGCCGNLPCSILPPNAAGLGAVEVGVAS